MSAEFADLVREFEREEENLFCEIPVKFVTAAIGGEVRVPTLEGQASLKIPAGTQGGTVFKLRSRGMPSLSSGVRPPSDQANAPLLARPIAL